MRIDHLGEDGILAAITPLLPRGSLTEVGPGDDCAVLQGLQRPVITTDVLVEGRHFRTDYCAGSDVGWRAAIANLADVAAMGATPVCLVVALVLPGSTELAWVKDLATGLAQACERVGSPGYEIGVVGGDLSQGPAITVSITAVGEAGQGRVVLRSGAQPGDTVAVAGQVGWSAAGLALLQAGVQDADGVARRALQAYRRPDPPLACGPAAAAQDATAMLDISDGLVRDAGRLARASAVGLDLDGAVIDEWASPLAGIAGVTGTGVDPRMWVLGGGEDHALLGSFPASHRLPEGFVPVGRVGLPGRGTVTLSGRDITGVGGWDHFGG